MASHNRAMLQSARPHFLNGAAAERQFVMPHLTHLRGG